MRLLTKQARQAMQTEPRKRFKKKSPRNRRGIVAIRSAEGVRFFYTDTQVRSGK